MMASSTMVDTASSCELLEEFLRCMVCFEPYHSPKVLQCQHTFCEACLYRWNSKGGGSKGGISCPTCRKRTPLTDSHIAGLPSDFKLNRLSELLQQVLVKESNDRRPCDICLAGGTRRPASHFCAQCSESFCEECHQRHGQSPLLAQHHMVDLALEDPGGKLFCTRHGAKPIRYICQTCCVFICTVCALTTHTEHAVQELESGLQKQRQELGSQADLIHSKQEQVRTQQEQLQELQIALKAYHEDTEDRVHRHVTNRIETTLAAQYELQELLRCKAWPAHLEEVKWAVSSMQEAATEAITHQATMVTNQMKDIRTHLLEDLKDRYTAVSAQLNDHIDAVSFHLASMVSLSSFLDKLLAAQRPLEVITVYDELCTRVKSVLETDIDALGPSTFTLIVFKPNEGDYNLGSLVNEETDIPQFLSHANLHDNVPADDLLPVMPLPGPSTDPGQIYQNMQNGVPGCSDAAPEVRLEPGPELVCESLGPPPLTEPGPEGYVDLETIDETSEEGDSPPSTARLPAHRASQSSIEPASSLSMGAPSTISQASSQSTLGEGSVSDAGPSTRPALVPRDAIVSHSFHRSASLPGPSQHNGWKHTSSNNTISGKPDDFDPKETHVKEKRLSLPVVRLHLNLDNPSPPAAHQRMATTPDVGTRVPWIHTMHTRSLSVDESLNGSIAREDNPLPGPATAFQPTPTPVELAKARPVLLWERTGSGIQLSSKKQAKRQRAHSTGSAATTAAMCELRQPTDACFLPSGEVLVADRGERCLQILTADTFMWSKVRERRQPLVTARTVAGGLVDPVCITLSKPTQGKNRGTLVAATDGKARCVKMIDIQARGSCVAMWGKSWFTPMFKHPSGLARTREGRWIVTDIGRHTVTLHTPEGQCLHQFGSRGKGNYGFESPSCVVIDQHEHLLVADSGNSVVKIYDSNAQFRCRVGLRGSGALSFPMGMCVDNAGHVLVADKANNTVQLYTVNGQHIRSLLGPTEVSAPCGLALSQNGLLAVTQLNPPAVKLYHLQ